MVSTLPITVENYVMHLQLLVTQQTICCRAGFSLRIKLRCETSGKTKSKEQLPSMNEAGRLMYRFCHNYPNIMTLMVIHMTQVVTSVMCKQEFSKQN